MAMPDPGASAPGEDNPYIRGGKPIVFEGFSTLNTDASRPGIENDQMFICDGFMPLGKNNLRTLYGVGPPIITPPLYCPQPITITQPVEMATSTNLTTLPATFSTFVLSFWIFIPDTGLNTQGIYFSNQTDDTLGSVNGGLWLKVQNDRTGTPQISIKGFDATPAVIFSATYNWTNWAQWVNLQFSVSTASNVIQAYANTGAGGAFVETALTPTSLTWSSTNPVANPSGQPWHVVPV